MRYLLLNILALLFSMAGYAQHAGVRYKQTVFDKVEVQRNIPYAPTPSKRKVAAKNLMDIYMPGGDTAKNRPLIMWLHGGGFKFGNKTSRGTPLWCMDFAQKGYVCVAINYQKSKKNTLTNFKQLVLACTGAMNSLQHAIHYCKEQYAGLGIDTNRIILAGNSAGAMAALHAVFANEYDLKQMIEPGNTPPALQQYNTQHIKAVVNFWGGIYNPQWLSHARAAIVSVHGINDKIVPYNTDKAPIYGSYAIHLKADSLGIPNALKTYPLSHELQKKFNPFWAGSKTKKRLREAGNFAALFLYEQVIK